MRRTSVTAAVLACALSGCTTAAPVATPAPPPDSSAAVGAAPVSRAALLTPDDFGPGYTVAEPAEEAAQPVEPAYLLPIMDCPEWRPGPDGPSGTLVLAGARQLYAAPRGHFDGLAVWRYRAGGAERALREVRDQLRLCARYERTGDEDSVVTTTWTVLAGDFAGAGSVAVRTELARDGVVSNVDFFVIVRRADAVATLWLSDQRWTKEALLMVGQRMASRLADV
jgi:hypothetical protein